MAETNLMDQHAPERTDSLDALDAPTLIRPGRLPRRSALSHLQPLEEAPSGSVHNVNALRARFWGVRGSYPLTTTQGTRVGGATTCLEMRYRRHIVIIDAGSGIIALGEALASEWRGVPPDKRPSLTLLFTHAHHDHLCGLPFFAPLYDPNAQITFIGPDLAGMRFAEIIAGYMRSPYFPVDFSELPSQRRLYSIGDGARLIWTPDSEEPQIIHKDDGEMADEVDEARTYPVRRESATLSAEAMYSTLHPRDGTLIYRLSAADHSLVFATDVEVGSRGEEADARFVRFAQGADLLAHDAQYSAEDYFGLGEKATVRGFGHSTPEMAAQVARAAGVKRLALIHHNPAYDDAAIEALANEARRHFPDVVVAHEGLELTLGEGAL